MAKMLGQRLTYLQSKGYNVRLNMEQIQHIVDGLVENRKNIVDDGLDLYDSMMMDFLEDLERQDVYFTDLVLGEEEPIDEVEDAQTARALALLALAQGMMPLISKVAHGFSYAIDDMAKVTERRLLEVIAMIKGETVVNPENIGPRENWDSL